MFNKYGFLGEKEILCLTGDIIPLTPFAVLTPSLDKEGIIVGKDEFNRKVYLDIDKLPNSHGIITGTTGSGKSTLARSLAFKIYKEKGIKIIFIDPHGEHASFVRDVLKGKIIDLKNIPGIMDNQCYTPIDWSNELSSIFSNVYNLTDFQTYILQQAFLEALDKGSLENVPLYIKKNFYLSPLVKELFFKINPILSIFNTDIEISQILEEDAIDLSLFSLQNKELSRLAMLIVLNQIDMYMKCKGVRNKIDTVVIVDEAHRIFTLGTRNVLVRAYQETRKFGYSFWSINQLPGQIPYELYQLAGFLFFLPGPVEYVKELESIAMLTEEDRDFLLYSIKGSAVFIKQGDPRPLRIILENIKEAFK